MTASSVAAEQWFKRYNSKDAGERGGAQEHGNEAEGLAGADPQGLGRSCEPGAGAGGEPGEDYMERSLEQQYRDALESR